MNHTRQHKNKVTLARLKDLDEITKILNQAIKWGNANAYTNTFKSAERLQWFNDHVHGKFTIYVFKEDTQVLGYLSISPYRQGRGAFKHTAEVSYYVDFNHHKKGIASQLMQKAFEHCSTWKIKTLLAFLYNHNEPSITFLKKFGFEEWGLFPRTAVSNGKEFDHVVYGKRVG